MQQDLFQKRIRDTAEICERNSALKFLGFLSDEEAVFAEKTLAVHACRYGFWGGYKGASRVVLGCFPDWAQGDEFPVAAVTLSFHKGFTLTHRDFLGSIMALGLKRETIGDILVEDGRAVVFTLEETAPYLLSQLDKVGRVGVTAVAGFSEPLPPASVLRDFSATVSSARLDCVVAALTDCSRGAALQKIEQGMVSVNSFPCEKPTKQITGADILSVRGKGKYKIESICDKTKKGRWILNYKKYI